MIPVSIDDPELAARLEGLAPDGLSLFTIGSPEGPRGGELRGALLHGTRLVNQMRANHGLGLMETFVLGQAYLAAGLLASTLKGDDSIGLRLDCEGPVQGFSVEAKAQPAPAARAAQASPGSPGTPAGGTVRGYLFRAPIPLDAPPERFDLAPLVGSGSLSLTRFIAGAPRPHTGTTRLKTGRLAPDLASYFLESEQVATAFDFGIHFDAAGRAIGAGGLYLQALPGATASFLERAEAALGALPPLGRFFAEGGLPSVLLASTFGALGLEARGRAPLSFSCPCGRERFAAFLSGAKGGLLEELIAEGPWPAEVLCHNCGSRYEFSREELEALLAARA